MRMRVDALCGFVAICGGLLSAPLVQAKPFAGAGDAWLRHDVLMMTDLGALSAPIGSWPLMFANVGEVYDGSQQGDGKGGGSKQRLLRRLSDESTMGLGASSFCLGATSKPNPLRGFEDLQRDGGLVRSRTSFLMDRLVVALDTSWVRRGPWEEAASGELRLDGTHAAVLLGNWAFTAGAMPRWWGPGRTTSLMLSQNARPAPALSVERLSAEPLDLPVLQWLGPWRAQFFLGQMEEYALAGENLYMGLRLEARPHRAVEIGLSRLMPWCRENATCNGDTFFSALLSQPDTGAAANLPAQKNGIDWRLVSPWSYAPVAFYGQVVFLGESRAAVEDFQYLLGAEAWLEFFGASLRLHGEYIDTRYQRIDGNSAASSQYAPLVFAGLNTASSIPDQHRAWATGLSVADPWNGFWVLGAIGVLDAMSGVVSSVTDLQMTLSYRLQWGIFGGKLLAGVAQNGESTEGWASLMMEVRH